MAKKGTKTYVNPKTGKRRHTTKWQKLVSQHGIKGAKKHYVGYKQVPPPPTTTGNIRSVKGGTRRVKSTNVGGGRRSLLYYKGDKVGTWAKSRGNTTKGRSGLGWYQERGYGTARKPVPDSKVAKRLGIAGKGKESAGKPIITPGTVAGLNEEEEWEVKSHKKAGKKVSQAEGVPDDANQDFMYDWQNAEDYDAELTMWQRAVKKHGVPPKTRSKGHGHGAFKAYRGRKQKDGVMYTYGDKTSKWTPSGGYTTKGVNTGRGWFMERGMGTPRNPIPTTPLTKRLGIAGAGTQQRQAGGLWGKMKRILVPRSKGGLSRGLNTQQDWEMQYFRKHKGLPLFQAESVCPSCGCGCQY